MTETTEKKTETTEKKESKKYKAEELRRKLTEDIINGSDVNETDGVITETASTYYDHLPTYVRIIDPSLADVSDKTILSVVEATEQYQDLYIASSAEATGRLGVSAMKGNKKLDTVTSEYKFGQKNFVRHALHREKTYTFGSGADRKEITHNGVISTEIDIRGGRNSGQFKSVKDEIKELAASQLKGFKTKSQ